ncbi:uncharacterized protein LOC143909124 isoform X1 [Arctopsyche grandis]|uniref:uncharacterized protein LOC143909124 isoform X1 n=1 Tax=Arctopsyche grandis TaxID=121162 RepID=UPI00406D7FBE
MRGGLLVVALLQAAGARAAGAPAASPRAPPNNILSVDDDEPMPDIDEDDDQDNNSTERGLYLGAPCDFTCNVKLRHVFCDPVTGHCECEKKYPVKLGATKGCAKPKSLGEQCFYRQTCKFMDPHASCVQVNHNAICQCDNGYHSVSYTRPVKKVFCTEDMAMLTADVPTLLGVCSGIAVLAGLLCLVLHLYTRGRMPDTRAHHYADANLSPPMLFTSETGIPLALQGLSGSRPGSRASGRSSIRRTSPGPRGALAASRAGAARAAAILLISCRLTDEHAPATASPYTHPLPAAGSRRSSLASIQSTSSSVRSYSMRRFEKEREQKEKRQQMQMRLAQLHANMTGESKNAPTPSPRTPNSTDGLLPAVNEGGELSLSQSPGLTNFGSSSLDGIIGPCSSSGTSY